MGYENFTTFTEVDPNSHIALVGTDHIDFVGYRNEDAYLYKDYGADHFGDFTHTINVRIITEVNSGIAYFWSLATVVDDIKGIEDASETQIGVCAYGGPGGDPATIITRESHAGSGYLDQSVFLTLNTWYYLKIVKSGASFVCGIYSTAILRDAGDGTDGDIDNLALTLQADHTLRYVFAANTWNSADAITQEIDIENLDLQEVTDKSASDSGAGADIAALAAILSKLDSGAGAEAVDLAATLPLRSDSGVGSEVSSVLGLYSAQDSGVGLDLGEVLVPLVGSDSGVGLDSFKLLVRPPVRTLAAVRNLPSVREQERER